MTLAQLDGQARLIGGETAYFPLGVVTSNRFDPKSVCNPTGCVRKQHVSDTKRSQFRHGSLRDRPPADAVP